MIMASGKVALEGIPSACLGKRCVVPGFLNKLSVALVQIFPKNIVLKVVMWALTPVKKYRKIRKLSLNRAFRL